MIDRRRFLQLPLFGLPFFLSDRATGQTRVASRQRVRLPVIISTWDSGIIANSAGWPSLLKSGGDPLDAVEAAARAVESEPSCCVGLDAFPDRDGTVTLDASIMNGNGDCGAVSFLQRIKHPVSVARKLMETTPHVMLSGDGAKRFAIANGFTEESERLHPDSEKAWKEWLKKSEYRPRVNIENQPPAGSISQFAPQYLEDGSPNHDTMGTIALDRDGKMAGMVTTSGMAFKMHGRVGDSPIIGAGLFVDDEVGAATSSGVGEEVIRICGTHTVVEQMRVGRSPEQACREAIRRIVKRDATKAKGMQVGFLAISNKGEIGAFAIQSGFTYSVTNEQFPGGRVFESKSFFPKTK
jgi:N4-(beta-N-acetylglucosaminyl)-L-asparaginase